MMCFSCFIAVDYKAYSDW